MHTYPFSVVYYRAQCLQVCGDGGVDLFVDLGMGVFCRRTFYLIGVGQLDKPEARRIERVRTSEICEWLRDLVKPIMVKDTVLMSYWPLKLVSSGDLEHPGLYHVNLWTWDANDDAEVHVNRKLESLGLLRRDSDEEDTQPG